MKTLLRKLFARTPTAAPEGRLELISIHVPKCAGSSFRRVLEAAYPEEGAFQPLYHREQEVKAIWDGGLPTVDARARAIHGHFPATPALRDAFPEARMIAWIREPVARTVSWYYFWQRTPRHGNPAHDQFLDVAPTLAEFAAHPGVQREMLSYFERVAVEDFYFIGLMERFDDDVHELASRLGWPEPEVPRENVAKERPALDEAELRAVGEALAETVELYRRIKAWRGLDDESLRGD